MKFAKMLLGNKDGKYTIKDGDKTLATFTRIYMSFPADAEAMDDWHKTKTFEQVVDGVKIIFLGKYAAAAAQAKADTEYVRGQARNRLKKGESAESVQLWTREKMLAYRPGQSLVTQEVNVSERTAMDIMAIEDPAERGRALVAYLATLAGIKINKDMDEDEDEINEDLPTEDELTALKAAEMAAEVDRKLAKK